MFQILFLGEVSLIEGYRSPAGLEFPSVQLIEIGKNYFFLLKNRWGGLLWSEINIKVHIILTSTVKTFTQ